jgi:NTE family protein
MKKKKPVFNKPVGLVLAGGGSLGAWQAGALEGFVRAGLAFDDVLGFSIGSLNGAGYCLDKMDILLDIWRNIDESRIMRFRPRLFPFALYANDAIAEVVTNTGGDEEAMRSCRSRFTVVSTDRFDDSHCYARFTPGGRNGWDGPIAQHMIASCSIPLVFPPVQIEVGGRTRHFVDGGVWVSEKISFEALAACEDVIVLVMTRPDELGRDPGWGYMPRREQTVREGLWDYIDVGLSTLSALPHTPRVYKVYPSKRLSYSMLGFKTRFCRPAVEQGVRDAESFLKDPSKFLVKC